MKRVRLAGVLAAMVLVAGAGISQAQIKEYKIDPAHSEADFSIKHLVHGSFHGVNGIVKFDPADPAKSSVEATIDVSTVDTGVAGRDTHLKSPDFFEVAKFPTMTFKSTSVARSGSGYAVTGDLTMHGVTKSIVLMMEAPSKAQMNGGKEHRGFTATTTIKRQDFGLSWSGKPLSTGDAVLGDDVKIELDIDAAA
jgi:polyisoprenoid-binding protein YceI